MIQKQTYTLVAAACLATTVCAHDLPSLCGVRLGDTVAVADRKLNLRKIGPEEYIQGELTRVGSRWEGTPRRPATCPKVHTTSGDQPSVILSASSAPDPAIRAMGYRMSQFNCSVAESAISLKLGAPSSTSVETVEWRPSSKYFVLLTRYVKEDCWLNYVLSNTDAPK